jgi:MYXO-CTERM domain-containing protein
VMMAQHDVPYMPLQSAELYPASGNTVDWAYGTHGIYAIALELRPGPEAEIGFVLSPSDIVPTGEEVVHAIAELIETAVELGPGEPGGGDTGTTGDGTTGAQGGSTGPASTGGFDESTGELTSATGHSDDAPPAGTAFTSDGSSDDDAAPQDLDVSEGCACQHGQGTRSAWWALGVLGLGLRRRARRAPSVRLEPPQHPPR